MKNSLYLALIGIAMSISTAATAQIDISFSFVPPSCNGYTNGTATANPSGGAGPYAYDWGNGQSGQTLVGVGAGTYTVTVTDNNGLTASGSVTITEPDLLLAQITADGLSCDGTSGTLTASANNGTAPYSYNWSTQETTQSIAVTGPNIYYVTVTDGNGCADVADFNVPTSLVIDVQVTDVKCANDPNSGALNVTATGGVAPYTYAWEDGNGDPVRQNMPAGTYTVTVTSANGCTAVDQGTITMPPPLEVTIVSITPACAGSNNGAATILATGGTPPYTFTWTPGGYTGSTVTGLAPGQYYVCTFDANHCQKDLWVVIPEITGLEVELSVVSAHCPGVDDGVVTAIVTPPGNYNYHWNLPPFMGVNQLAGLPANTFVSVTVTDPNSGCMGTDSATVSAHNAIHVDVTDTDIPCQGQNIGTASANAYGGTPDYTYVWLTPPDGPQIGVGPNITGLAPGAYMVSVTDAIGCTALGVADIGIESGPNADIGGLNLVKCGSLTTDVQFENLSVDPFDTIVSWVWTITTNGNTQTFNNSSPVQLTLPVGATGTAILEVTSSTGCVDTAMQQFTVPGIPDISLNVGPISVDCQNDSVYLEVQGGQPWYDYTWSPLTGLLLDPTPPNATAFPDETTTYQLIANDHGCMDTVSVEVVRVTPVELSVDQSAIETCDSTVVLNATSNVANVIWVDAHGNVLGGNPVTVVAGDSAVYTAIATGEYGCVDSVQVVVIGHGISVDVDPEMPTVGCVGTDIQLGLINHHPNDTLTYQWSAQPPLVLTGENSSTPTVSGPAGDYVVTVTVTNQYGCPDTIEIPVGIDEMQSIQQAISADLCDGKIVKFFNTSGVLGMWYFGDGDSSSVVNPVHAYANAGSYGVTFTPTDNFCIMPWDSTIHVQDAPLSPPQIDNNYVVCIEQAQIQFTGASNNPDVDWTWIFTGGSPDTSHIQNPVVTFNEEGTITAELIITDENGCADSSFQEVQVIFIDDHLQDTIYFCKGDSVQLNPDGVDPTADYHWTSNPADPNLAASEKNPWVSPEVTTVYSVSITQGTFCSVTYDVTVIPLDGPHLDTLPDIVVCKDTILTLTANGTAVSYLWSDNPAFDTILSNTNILVVNGTQNAVYYVKASALNGCYAEDSLRVRNGIIDIDIEPANQVICEGDEAELVIANLDPNDQLTYNWTPNLPNQPTQTVSPTEETNYHVAVSNQWGCLAEADFNVKVITVDVNAEVTGPDTICPGQYTTLLATPSGNGTFYSFVWSPADGLNNANIPDPIAAPTENQVYTVTVTTDNGCTATDEVEVFFMSGQCVEPYIFVPKAFTPNHDENNDFFIVRGVNITELQFIVWDRWGEKVFETTNPLDQGWDGTFKGRELTPDSYAWYVRARCGNGAIYEKKGDVTLLK